MATTKTFSAWAIVWAGEHGFAYSGAAKGTTEGLPDFYQTSFHTADYVKQAWGRYFEVLDIKEGAISSQDAALLRKP